MAKQLIGKTSSACLRYNHENTLTALESVELFLEADRAGSIRSQTSWVCSVAAVGACRPQVNSLCGPWMMDVGGYPVEFQELSKGPEECSAIKSRYMAQLHEGRHMRYFSWAPRRVSLVIEKLAQ
jgi:hypothetical protein